MENNLKRQFFSARNIELNNRLHRMKDWINDNLKQVPDNSMQGKNGSCRIIIQKCQIFCQIFTVKVPLIYE